MKKLRNPKTEKYLELKKFVCGENFPWFINECVVEQTPYQNRPNWSYCHPIMSRPEMNHYAFSETLRAKEFVEAVSEILDFNGYNNYFLLRIATNSTHPVPEKERTVGWFHSDHDWEHHNLIVYLTPTDGATYVQDKPFYPEVDDVLTFQGTHAQQYPTQGRRVVLVATYMLMETDKSWRNECVEMQNKV